MKPKRASRRAELGRKLTQMTDIALVVLSQRELKSVDATVLALDERVNQLLPF